MAFKRFRFCTISFNLACLVIVIMGSAFAMFSLGRLYGGDPGGWIAAAAYIYAPYFCVNLYVRSALAEFAAFPFFALTLYGFGAFAKQQKLTQLALGAAGFAGVLLAHNPAALLFAPLILAFLGFTAWQSHSWRILRTQLGGLALGLALSAFVWLPALLERPLVNGGTFAPRISAVIRITSSTCISCGIRLGDTVSRSRATPMACRFRWAGAICCSRSSRLWCSSRALD